MSVGQRLAACLDMPRQPLQITKAEEMGSDGQHGLRRRVWYFL